MEGRFTATLSKGYTFGATESVTNTKLHNLVDLGSISDIVNADIAVGANIDSSKLDLSSAGYLTTGGNFDITGRHSQADLVWFNTSSHASIANSAIQRMVLTSLASIATADIVTLTGGSATLKTSILTSIASIAVGHHTTLRSGTPNQGDILFDDGTDIIRLPPGDDGQFLKTQGTGANPVWSDLTGGKSNVIAQLPVQLGSVSAPPTYAQVGESMYWEKNAEISTIYIKHKGKCASGSSYSLKLNVGGQEDALAVITSPTTSSWRDVLSVDVSSLSDGTVYEMKILVGTATTVQVDVDAFSMWGE